ncbi:MAG: hypothetical protein ABH863_02210 [Candidatus Micrarchaeota archaeon]
MPEKPIRPKVEVFSQRSPKSPQVKASERKEFLDNAVGTVFHKDWGFKSTDPLRFMIVKERSGDPSGAWYGHIPIGNEVASGQYQRTHFSLNELPKAQGADLLNLISKKVASYSSPRLSNKSQDGQVARNEWHAKFLRNSLRSMGIVPDEGGIYPVTFTDVFSKERGNMAGLVLHGIVAGGESEKPTHVLINFAPGSSPIARKLASYINKVIGHGVKVIHQDGKVFGYTAQGERVRTFAERLNDLKEGEDRHSGWAATVAETARRHFPNRSDVTPDKVGRKINSLADDLLAEKNRTAAEKEKTEARNRKLADIGKIAKRKMPFRRLGDIRRRLKHE